IRNDLVTGPVPGHDRERDTMEERFRTRATQSHKGAPCRSPSPATAPQISTSPRSTTQRAPIPVTATPWRDRPVRSPCSAATPSGVIIMRIGVSGGCVGFAIHNPAITYVAIGIVALGIIVGLILRAVGLGNKPKTQ